MEGQPIINNTTGTAAATTAAQDTRPYLSIDPTNPARKTIDVVLLADYMINKLSIYIIQDKQTGARIVYQYRNGTFQEAADEEIRNAIKNELVESAGSKHVNRKIIKDALAYIKDSTPKGSVDDLDSACDYINIPAGMLNLGSLTVVPHGPQFLSTIQIDIDWTGAPSPTPTWDKYIRAQSTDPDFERLLLEYIGLTISNIPGYKAKKALMLYGPGDSGRSKYLDFLGDLLGSNFFPMDLSALEDSHFAASSIYGKRLVGSGDMGYLKISELKLFKQLTGGDVIRADRKFAAEIAFRYRGTLCYCTNDLPRFGGDSGDHVYRRWMIVPFLNSIPEAEQDKEIAAKLHAERNGIAYKAIMALRDMIGRDYRFTEPACATQMRQQYKQINSPVEQFLTECVTERKMDSDGITVTGMYSIFCEWAKTNAGHKYSLTKKEFSAALQKHYYKTPAQNETEMAQRQKRTQQGMIWRDYTLADETKEEYRYVVNCQIRYNDHRTV